MISGLFWVTIITILLLLGGSVWTLPKAIRSQGWRLSYLAVLPLFSIFDVLLWGPVFHSGPPDVESGRFLVFGIISVCAAALVATLLLQRAKYDGIFQYIFSIFSVFINVVVVSLLYMALALAD